MSKDAARPPAGDPLAAYSATPQELKDLIRAKRAAKPFIAFRDDKGSLHLFVLDEQRSPLTIGRRAAVNIVVAWDAEISGLHAELRCLGGEWTIVDDGLSTNGTFVNDQRVSGRRRLSDGDRVRVGSTVLAFDAASDDSLEGTVTAGNRQPVSLSESQRRVVVALCRPFRERVAFATPASNKEIANELFISVDTVKTHLRAIFAKFGLDDLPQNEKRARLAETVMHSGLISPHDL